MSSYLWIDISEPIAFKILLIISIVWLKYTVSLLLSNMFNPFTSSYGEKLKDADEDPVE